PGAEIDIAVGENDPFRLGGAVGVGADAADIGDLVGAVELRVAAPLTGDVGAQPVVEAITGAEAEDSGSVEAELLRRGQVVGIERVVEAIDALVGEADIAAQIPAADILDSRA